MPREERGHGHKEKPVGFLVKTYEILMEERFSKIISWVYDGKAFQVKAVNEFTTEVLPKYFKHSNFASFVRQLNMYDFHKRKDCENVYEHPYFVRGKFELLKLIRRKSLEPMAESALAVSGGGLSVSELHSISRKQQQLEEKCKKIYNQNETLTRENQLLKSKIAQLVEQQKKEMLLFMLFYKSILGEKDLKRTELTSRIAKLRLERNLQGKGGVQTQPDDHFQHAGQQREQGRATRHNGQRATSQPGNGQQQTVEFATAGVESALTHVRANAGETGAAEQLRARGAFDNPQLRVREGGGRVDRLVPGVTVTAVLIMIAEEKFDADCVQLLRLLRAEWPDIYRAVARLMFGWRDNPGLEIQTVMREMLDLFRDKNELKLAINKVLPEEIRLPAKAEKLDLINLAISTKPKAAKLKVKRIINQISSIKKAKGKITNEDLAEVRQHEGAEPPPLKKKKPESGTAKQPQKTFFERLQDSLGQTFSKLLHLYYLAVIPASELLQAVGDRLGEQDRQSLIDAVVDRESARHKLSMFKPLTDLEFKDSEKASYSYVRMPHFYPNICSGSHKLGPREQVINRMWVSVPIGSEHGNKNQYQEELFKCQDNMYEVDYHIQLYKKCQALLCREGPTRNAVEELISFRVIRKLYAQYGEEVEGYVRAKPVEVCARILQRLQEKVREIEELKLNQKRLWQESYQKNYHRSLDHRSHYFKKNDKRLTQLGRFEKEADFRYLRVVLPQQRWVENKDGFEGEKEIFLQRLNSFQGLSNFKVEDQVKGERELLPREASRKGVPAIFRLVFNKKDIMADVLTTIVYFLQSTHNNTNATQRQRIRQCLQLVCRGFGTKFEEVKDKLINEPRITERAQQVERQIYQRNVIERSKSAAKEEEEQEDQKRRKKEVKASSPVKEDQDFYSLISQSSQEIQYLYEGEEAELDPPIQAGETSFFGSKAAYCFLRLFYSLYERFLQAKQFAGRFEHNAKTDALEREEVGRLAQERYDVFKQIVLLRAKDSSFFEDQMRMIFQQNSFRFSTLDKLISSSIKCLQKVVAEEVPGLMTPVMSRQQESVVLARLSKHALRFVGREDFKGGYYRFFISGSDLLINYFESPYKGWNLKEAKATFQKLAGFLVEQSDQQFNQNTFFMYDLSETLVEEGCQPAKVRNGMEMFCAVNGSSLNVYRGHDTLLRRQPKATASSRNELKRARKFLAFLEQRTAEK